MKTLLFALLVSAAPSTCGTTPGSADGGADMTVAVLGQPPPDLSLPQDGISAPGTCQIPGFPCGNGTVVCSINTVCVNDSNCVPACVDSMQCPFVSLHPCPAGYIDVPAIGCFLPCYASSCASGCPG